MLTADVSVMHSVRDNPKEPRTAKCAPLVASSAVFFAFCLLAGGCSQKPDADGIRAGIREHLVQLKTLDLNAMDFTVTNVEIRGNQAQAQAEFRPKTGAPPGAEMRVTYVLEKREGNWVVIKTQAVGGIIDHPAAGANPHGPPPGAVHNLPNFHDILPPGSADSDKALPPGHPPVNPTPPADPPKKKS
ncbi:MAG TPA: hypothetical protein VEH49_08605 [Methylomirabilota bacterium]|nr:hypothetical protein [Methylomirabilota bacterium]